MFRNNEIPQLDEKKFLIFSLFAVFVIVLLRSAWVCDDAYITLRTVDNFYNGYGLTWNIGERVQTFTHPLWMLLISLIYFVEDNPYFSLIGLSVLLSTFTLYLLINKISITASNSIIGILLLLSSKSFIDYSTSGLENPLTHLIYAIYIIVFLNYANSKYSTLILALLAAFGMLNRMDSLLLFLPGLIYVVFQNRTRQNIKFIVLGFLPFILWEVFSLYYYGFLFPNTAYAKLNTGIAGSLLAKQGVLYILHSLSRDPGSLFIIALGIFISIKARDWRKITLSLGIMLYLIYVVRIGGDFMAGRFFSALVLGATTLIISTNLFRQNYSFSVFIFILVIIFKATPEPPIMYNIGTSGHQVDVSVRDNGINDERRWYSWATGLITLSREELMPRMALAAEGKQAGERGYSVVDEAQAGVFGFYAGPTVHVVDWYALGDPLLARLPVDNVLSWRIGHFYREIPDGYRETLETGDNHIVDPNLAIYYDKLSIITKGNLFDKDRFVEIWKINTGYYQPFVDAYLATQ